MALRPEDVIEAAARLSGRIHRTPVFRSATLDARTGASVYLKCENLQKVGAFKFRGATHALLRLSPEELRRGVTTHSSGNHAQALARAAREAGVPACVVMPETAPRPKRQAVLGYGAEVVTCAPTQAAREASVREVVAERGMTLVHPFDDDRVIAGQGTAALELIEEVPDLDRILVPVGGGGLASGTGLAAASRSGGPRVVGVEPAMADDARRSLAAGRILPSGDPRTVADGLRTSLSERTFALVSRYLEGIVAVEEAAIVAAMRFLLERTKILVEASAAVPVAALLEGAVPVEGQKVGVILSGGNADLDALPWVGKEEGRVGHGA